MANDKSESTLMVAPIRNKANETSLNDVEHYKPQGNGSSDEGPPSQAVLEVRPLN
jgi:hypothetical protein